jgi:hypothetical protein
MANLRANVTIVLIIQDSYIILAFIVVAIIGTDMRQWASQEAEELLNQLAPYVSHFESCD